MGGVSVSRPPHLEQSLAYNAKGCWGLQLTSFRSDRRIHPTPSGFIFLKSQTGCVPAAQFLPVRIVLQVPAVHWGCSCSTVFTSQNRPADSCGALGMFLQHSFYQSESSCRLLWSTGDVPAAQFLPVGSVLQVPAVHWGCS